MKFVDADGRQGLELVDVTDGAGGSQGDAVDLVIEEREDGSNARVSNISCFCPVYPAQLPKKQATAAAVELKQEVTLESN